MTTPTIAVPNEASWFQGRRHRRGAGRGLLRQQRGRHHSWQQMTIEKFQVLQRLRSKIPQALRILDLEQEIIRRPDRILELRITAARIPCLGDYRDAKATAKSHQRSTDI
jgi:hypothetical protein